MPHQHPQTQPCTNVSHIIVFPQTVKRIRLADDAVFNNRHIVLLFNNKTQRSNTGVLCELIDEQYHNGQRFVVLEGMQRVQLLSQSDGTATFIVVDESFTETPDLMAVSHELFMVFKEHFHSIQSDDMSLDTLLSIIDPNQPNEMTDFIASYLPLTYSEHLSILESHDTFHRIKLVQHMLNKAVIDSDMNQQLDTIIDTTIEAERKELLLKAKLRAIQSELNETNQAELAKEYEAKLTNTTIPNDSLDQIKSDINRLNYYPEDSTEFSVIKAYLDCLFSIPWGTMAKKRMNVDRVRAALDKYHYGLDSVKVRIIEHLAIKTLSKQPVGTILCLTGPPGVGKTSIVASIAAALKRQLCHISLAGIKDESDLRGHRRAYVGSTPGKIVSAIIKSKSMNPIICLDEIDKLSGLGKGDPSAVLLEILDIEQNKLFVDHYVQIPVDISSCMFVCTANDLSKIPDALRNRMEIIPIPGYSIDEKAQVAESYLFPTLCQQIGLSIHDIQLPRNLWLFIVNTYTSDVGLRELRHIIHKLCRKLAVSIVNKKPLPKKWTESTVQSLLGEGQPKQNFTIEPRIGRSVALTLQSMIGYCCPIETQIYQGKNGFTATGANHPSIHDAIRVVFGIIKSRFTDYSIDPTIVFNQHFHIHFQQSTMQYSDTSGLDLAIFVSIMSTLLNIPLPGTITFSAKLSLSGQLLPIGGVPQKKLSGSHLGLQFLMGSAMESLPSNNPALSTQFIPLNTVDDVMQRLLKWYL